MNNWQIALTAAFFMMGAFGMFQDGLVRVSAEGSKYDAAYEAFEIACDDANSAELNSSNEPWKRYDSLLDWLDHEDTCYGTNYDIRIKDNSWNYREWWTHHKVCLYVLITSGPGYTCKESDRDPLSDREWRILKLVMGIKENVTDEDEHGSWERLDIEDKDEEKL